MELYVLIALFWIGVSIVWGLVARRKGRSFLAIFALSIFVTPIIGMIVALLLQPTDAAKMAVAGGGPGRAVGPVPCPYCKEQIRADAIVCKHCGKDVEPAVDRILGEREKVRAAVIEAAQVAERQRVDAEAQRKQVRDSRALAVKEGIRKKGFLVPAISLGAIAMIGLAGFWISQTMAASLASANLKKVDREIADASKALGDWTSAVYACGAPPRDIAVSIEEIGNSAVYLTLSDPGVALIGNPDFANVTDQSVSLVLSDVDATYIDCVGGILGSIVVNSTDNTVKTLKTAKPLSEFYDPSLGGPVLNDLYKVNFQTTAVVDVGQGTITGPWTLSITKAAGFPPVFVK